MVLSAGISIYINTILDKSLVFDILSPIMRFGVKSTPYLLNAFLFTVMYRAIPNTKVNFKDAAIAGILTGSAFQLFQVLYIKGQVLLSRYDVVYGSFAALPLLLLWLQTSCLIVLLGADIAYASQNIKNYEFETDSKNISVRYKNFLTLFITWLIVKQYEQQQPPLSITQISNNHQIPIRLSNQILSNLVDCGILIEVFNDVDLNKTFQPAIDINQLSIALFFEKIESYGTEHFLENRNPALDAFWAKTHTNDDLIDSKNNCLLIKDL